MSDHGSPPQRNVDEIRAGLAATPGYRPTRGDRRHGGEGRHVSDATTSRYRGIRPSDDQHDHR